MQKHQKVKVLAKNEQGVWNVIKRGYVLKQTDTFAQVFEPPDLANNTGDPQPDWAEWFAFNAPRCRVVAI